MSKETRNNKNGINISVSPTISPVINQKIVNKEIPEKPEEKKSVKWQRYVAIVGGIAALIWVLIQIYTNYNKPAEAKKPNPKSSVEEIKENNPQQIQGNKTR